MWHYKNTQCSDNLSKWCKNANGVKNCQIIVNKKLKLYDDC